MTAEHLRLLIGFALMAMACSLSLAIGDRPIRMAAVLVAACWIIAFVGRQTTSMVAEPAIASEVICGLGLLYLASTYNTSWLWLMVGIEAILLCFHAWYFGTSETPPPAQIMGNNVLATADLIVLVAAAVHSRRSATAPMNHKPNHKPWRDHGSDQSHQPSPARQAEGGLRPYLRRQYGPDTEQ